MIYRMRTTILSIALVASVSLPASAQVHWKEIGKTSAGNTVFVDPRSVKTVNGLITARVRVKFEPPVATPQGPWTASHTLATFDCAKAAVAAKENIYYSDESANKVVERKVIAKPGFGPVLGGSMGKVALDYLCRKP